MNEDDDMIRKALARRNRNQIGRKLIISVCGVNKAKSGDRSMRSCGRGTETGDRGVIKM